MTEKAWSSLDKEESLACQITSPFNNKMGYFLISRDLLAALFSIFFDVLICFNSLLFEM